MEVVILDDDVLIIELLKRYLKHEHCVVSGYTEQLECLSYLSSVQPDYLFVDMRMPKMNGLVFINKLKDRGLNDTTKIFLCSGATPDSETLSQLDAMEIELINKNDLCNKIWLQSKLGLDNTNLSAPSTPRLAN